MHVNVETGILSPPKNSIDWHGNWKGNYKSVSQATKPTNKHYYSNTLSTNKAFNSNVTLSRFMRGWPCEVLRDTNKKNKNKTKTNKPKHSD